ncbi:hypothetical protein [Arcanobacterium hippocoleae]|uniref:hypothetical protein n=1 Tax=Arcanobacterium hippocoleae TaxID=149017 RepID=UPI0033414C69
MNRQRQRSLWELLAGVLLGGFAGSVAVIVHASPVDLAWVGLILATVIILTGGWLAYEGAGFLVSWDTL